MQDYLDDIAYLSQEIGPRPAGTEEEQDAAAYIADAFTRRIGLPAQIEDFSCNSRPELTNVILCGVTILFSLLAMIKAMFIIPAIIIGAICAVLYILEQRNIPVLSRLFTRGISQNVVAKYRPEGAYAGKRSRKIVVIANYDSGKVRAEMGMAGALPVLKKIHALAMILIPVIWLFRAAFSVGSTGTVAIVLNVILLILMLVAIVPIVLFILHSTAEYNEAANCNAAGVAAMMEVADRIVRAPAQADEAEEGVEIHGEEAARAEGLIPESADVEYTVRPTEEKSAEEEETSMSAAFRAIAVMTGRPVDEIETSTYKDERIARQEAAAEAARAAELAEEQAAEQEAEAVEANRPGEGDQATPAANGSQAAAPQPAAPASPQPAQAAEKPAVPDWYTRAQQKAARNRPVDDKPVRRSRFASALDEAVASSSAIYDEANKLIDEEGDRIENAANAGIFEVPAPREYVMPSVQEAEREAAEQQQAEEAVRVAEEAAREAEQAARAEQAADTAAEADLPRDPALRAIGNWKNVWNERKQSGLVFDEGDETVDMPTLHVGEPAREQSAEAAGSMPEAGTEYKPGRVLERSPELEEEAAYRRSAEAGRSEAPGSEEPVGEDDLQPVSDAPAVADGADGEESRSRRRHPRRLGANKPFRKKRDAASAEYDDREAAADAPLPDNQDEAFDPEDIHSYSRERYLRRSGNAHASEAPADDAVRSGETTAIDPIDVSELRAQAAGNRDAATVDAFARPAQNRDAEATRAIGSVQAGRTAVQQVDLEANLPQIGEPPKQRAPLAGSSRHDPALSSQIPRIDLGAFGVTEGAEMDNKRAALRNMLPSMSGSITVDPGMRAKRDQNNSVSLTGSFAPISTTGGNLAPVGDELLEGIDPDDVYVDDADDSVFEETTTSTGAYAGPGYLDMPESRSSQLFGRFHKKKEKKQEVSAQDWLDVDENFNAREAGAARGSWESFNEKNRSQYYGRDGYDLDDDDWNGGAFSRLRSRRGEAEDEGNAGEEPEAGRELRADSDDSDRGGRPRRQRSSSPFDDVMPLLHDRPQISRELDQVQDFHAKAVKNEVWFVALGSELAGNGGAKAFLKEHDSELRGSVIINLEGLGAGSFGYYAKEGFIKKKAISSRLKRMIRSAQRATGLNPDSSTMGWKDSIASLAMLKGIPAVTMVGLENGQPALMGKGDDVLENIDPEALEERIDFIEAMVRNA